MNNLTKFKTVARFLSQTNLKYHPPPPHHYYSERYFHIGFS